MTVVAQGGKRALIDRLCSLILMEKEPGCFFLSLEGRCMYFYTVLSGFHSGTERESKGERSGAVCQSA